MDESLRKFGSFNSIKVQLRPVFRQHLGKGGFFQFHKGTIKTCQCQQVWQVTLFFQFHKGTIKTHCFGIYNILVSNRICGCKVKKSY